MEEDNSLFPLAPSPTHPNLWGKRTFCSQKEETEVLIQEIREIQFKIP